jgi:hypothetical protein
LARLGQTPGWKLEKELLVPYPANQTRLHEISPRVESPKQSTRLNFARASSLFSATLVVGYAKECFPRLSATNDGAKRKGAIRFSRLDI